MTKLYAEISKTEEQPDGTIKVWGYASSEAVDSDGEVIKADAMKAALPDYLKFGAVREMHGSIAAGTAIDAQVLDDGLTFFGAHVVDPVAVKKVQTKVYKGFSIGGRVTKRDPSDPSIITGLKLVEVSLVDRPANPEAVFTMFKMEDQTDAVDALAKMVDDGAITPQRLLTLAKNATVEKGMYAVSQFAAVLYQLSWMVTANELEAQSEGDGSPVPAALHEWLQQGAAIFSQMAQEEIDEMLAYTQPDTGDSLTMSEASDPIVQPAEGPTMSDNITAVKAEATPADVPAETTPVVEKASTLSDEMAKALMNTITGLNERLAALESQPVAPKGVLLSVGKADGGSIGGTGAPEGIDAVKPVLKADGTIDPIATMVKMTHAMGGRPAV
jgi:hypothetical protein